MHGGRDLLVPERVIPASLVLGLLNESNLWVALDGGDATERERAVGLRRRRRSVPGEPRRVQSLVAHLAGYDNLESTLAQRHLTQRRKGAKIVVEQAVEAVALPVQVFLQSDHLPPNLPIAVRGSREPFRQRRS